MTDVYIIVQPEDLPSFERLFKNPVSAANHQRLGKTAQGYEKTIMEYSDHVHFIVQDRQEGFGHAVWCARSVLKPEPFVLVLGEHLYSSTALNGHSCLKQVLEAFKTTRQNIIGLQRTPIDSVSRFGTATGVWRRNAPNDSGPNPDDLLDISHIVEKPTKDFALSALPVDGIPADEFLTVFGLYVLSHRVFDILNEDLEHNVRINGQFQFTPALDRLRKEEGLLGCVISGQRFDIRDPESYMQAMITFPKIQAATAVLNSNAAEDAPQGTPTA